MAETEAKTVTRKSGWLQTERPFWWPDAQGFLMGAMVMICATAIFYRMTHPNEVNDKILDMMITISFSTCLVLIYNFAFGSSSSGTKIGDTQNRIVEKLTSTQPAGPPGPVAPQSAATVIVSWWSLLTPTEQAAIEAAQNTDNRVKEILDALQSGKAEAPDINDLVAKGLLTHARASLIIGD